MFEPLTGPEALAEAAAQRRFGWLLLALWLNSIALAIVLGQRGHGPTGVVGLEPVLANGITCIFFCEAPKGERLQAAGAASLVLALPLLLGGLHRVLRAVIWGLTTLSLFFWTGRWSGIVCVHGVEMLFMMVLIMTAAMALLPVLEQARDRARATASHHATVRAVQTAIQDLTNSPFGDQ